MDNGDLHEALVSEGFDVVGVIDKLDEGGGYFAYIRVVWGGDGSQSPSSYKMDAFKRRLKDEGVFLDFVVTDEFVGNAEAGLRAQLRANFSDFVRNSFLSLEKGVARVWVDPKPGIEDVLCDINKSVGKYLEGLNVAEFSVILTRDENTPSDFFILNALRQIAPASLVALGECISGNGLVVPSQDWLRKRLESRRKKGYVVWLKGEDGADHRYALTLLALKALGSEKWRGSPDVKRLLAMARGDK